MSPALAVGSLPLVPPGKPKKRYLWFEKLQSGSALGHSFLAHPPHDSLPIPPPFPHTSWGADRECSRWCKKLMSFLTSLSLRCCARAFSSCREQVLLFHIAMWVSVVGAWGSTPGEHMGSSQTSDRTCVSYINRHILNQWTTREVPLHLIFQDAFIETQFTQDTICSFKLYSSVVFSIVTGISIVTGMCSHSHSWL